MADFDSLGFNNNSVVVTANLYNIVTGVQAADNAVLSVPKADLISATVANAPIVTSNYRFTTPAISSPPADASSYDPALDYNSTGNEVLLALDNNDADLDLETISGGGGPTASVKAPVQVAITAINPAIPAPQPGGAPPVIVGPTIQTDAQNGLDSRFSGTAVETTLNGVPVLVCRPDRRERWNRRH